MIRHCSRGHAEHQSDGRYCRSCRAAYMRDWRRRETEQQASNVAFIPRETHLFDEEAVHLATAVADLSDELAALA